MYLASDNTGPAHPQVIEALLAANTGYVSPYGNDTLTAEAIQAIRTTFEAPDAEVFFIPTGTSGNALALSTLTMPYQSVLCAGLAHIHEDECAAPEFYGVAKLNLIGTTDLIAPATLSAEITALTEGGVHSAQPGAISITNLTERGQLYSLEQMRALADIAHAHDLPLHLDGARFGNAAHALGVSAADLSWRAGVDALTFGGTKSGCLGVEAVIFFDPARARGFAARRKRAGHLFSKNRFLAAQMLGYLKNDLWYDLAGQSNARGQYLARAMATHNDITWPYASTANMLFPEMPRHILAHLKQNGAMFNTWGDVENGAPDDRLLARFVCDWSLPYSELDRFLALLARA